MLDLKISHLKFGGFDFGFGTDSNLRLAWLLFSAYTLGAENSTSLTPLRGSGVCWELWGWE